MELDVQGRLMFRLLLMVSAITMIGCGTYNRSVKSTSDRELAAMYDITQDQRVAIHYRDTSTGRAVVVTTTDLMIQPLTASWTDANGIHQTILTEQIEKVTCTACKSNTGTGALIGASLGVVGGLLTGAFYDLAFSPVYSVAPDDFDEPNFYPTTIGLGILLGGATGAAIGSGTRSDAVWYFKDPQ